jgi:hypothetical protein
MINLMRCIITLTNGQQHKNYNKGDYMNKLLVVFIGAISTGLSAQAAELVTKTTATIEHRCSITVSSGNKSVTYLNFTPAVNTYSTVSGLLPANQRFKLETNGENKIINLNPNSRSITNGNSYSNCMSLVLAQDRPFAKPDDAKKYMLALDNKFIDVCWRNNDGTAGTSSTVSKVGVDKFGKDIITFSAEHHLHVIPFVEFTIAERSLVNDFSGPRLSLSPIDYLIANEESYQIRGEQSISGKIKNLNLDVNCSIEEIAVNNL